jgi:hypothetical protein
MKKLISILFISSLLSISHASNLDDWSNNDLCGWMESTSIPKYILNEVVKRKILCSGGLEVSALPLSKSNVSKNGTTFASPDPSLVIKINSEVKVEYSY